MIGKFVEEEKENARASGPGMLRMNASLPYRVNYFKSMQFSEKKIYPK